MKWAVIEFSGAERSASKLPINGISSYVGHMELRGRRQILVWLLRQCKKEKIVISRVSREENCTQLPFAVM